MRCLAGVKLFRMMPREQILLQQQRLAAGCLLLVADVEWPGALFALPVQSQQAGGSREKKQIMM